MKGLLGMFVAALAVVGIAVLAGKAMRAINNKL
jgi:hypothetical protein